MTVSVSRHAFKFCRWSIALVLWVSFFLRVKWLLALNLLILLSSAILKVPKSPLIVFYGKTLGKWFPSSRMEELDENGIAFAQGLGAFIHLILLLFVYVIDERIGWRIVFVIAIVKTLGALGYCTGLQIYKLLFQRKRV